VVNDKQLKILECNCTEGFKGKVGPTIDTLRCEFGEINCSIQTFTGKKGGKKTTFIKDVTVVKVNLENQ